MTAWRLAAFLSAALVVPALFAQEPPSSGELPFSKLSYAEARQLATEQGKLCIVDAIASWCVPCKAMERDAWPAPEVVAWMAAHAIAVQLDVDAQKEIAQELKIVAMPTIFVFAGATELDRREGAMSAPDLVSWLEGVAAGRAGHEPLVAKGLELLQSEDVQARFDIARELRRHGESELALKHYIWLWQHPPTTVEMAVFHWIFMLRDMKSMAERDEDAAEAVARLFEEVRAKVIHTDEPEDRAWIDFKCWCFAFDRDDQVLDWYDRHHGPDGRVRLSDAFTQGLLQTLIEAHRWADAARLGDLPALAAQTLADCRGARTKLRNSTSAITAKDLTMPRDNQAQASRTLAQFSAAAWAAGHDEDARDIAQSLLAEFDDANSRLALVQETLDAVGAQPEQRTWLEEAATKGGDERAIANLRRELRTSLEEQHAEAKATELVPPPEPVR